MIQDPMMSSLPRAVYQATAPCLQIGRDNNMNPKSKVATSCGLSFMISYDGTGGPPRPANRACELQPLKDASNLVEESTVTSAAPGYLTVMVEQNEALMMRFGDAARDEFS